MKVLIVEDDTTSRLLLQGILVEYGRVVTVENGLDAVRAVSAALNARDAFDLIFMDIMMPEMDGYEALREIRERESEEGELLERKAKIIMATSRGDLRAVMKAIRSQCDAYIVKPFDKAKIIAQLKAFQLIP